MIIKCNFFCRLIHHNCKTGQATLCDPQTNSSVFIDTTLTEPLESVVGSLFQVIGEVEQLENCGAIIKAKIMRCVDGLDLLLYSRALEIQQQYMQSRFSETFHS